MVDATLYFPPDFLWGTSTSAFQVEGDRVNNDWWEAPSELAVPSDVRQPGKACEWWGGRWAEDFDRAASGGQNSIRISIEWARIEPSPGIWDDDAVDYYRDLLEGAVVRGLTPVVALHHFTNPIWFLDLGGWENSEARVLFERYVRKTVSSLKEHVRTWITVNEPNVYLFESYVHGEYSPAARDLERAFVAAKSLILSHAAAYHAIHEIQPDGRVGMVHHFRGMQPSIPRSPLHRILTTSRTRSFNELFPRAVYDGRIRLFNRKTRIPQAARTQDFIGLNYFTSEQVTFDPRKRLESYSRGVYPRTAELSPSAKIANEPSGMFEALKYAKGFDLPIIVAGNGIDDAGDEIRSRYLAEHLRQIWAAISYNWNIVGYLHWTLVDCYEWESGWTQRFGLWSLDPYSQERSKRPSADFYADICRSNSLSTKSVITYAPEVLEKLFPSDHQREFVSRGR